MYWCHSDRAKCASLQILIGIRGVREIEWNGEPANSVGGIKTEWMGLLRARLILLAKRNDWEGEERVVRAQETRDAQVVTCETGGNTKGATSGLQMCVTGVCVGTEEDERNPKKEDEDKERDGTSGGSDKVDGRDTEPDPEVEADGAFGFGGIGGVLGVNTRLSVVGAHEAEEGDKDDRVAPPEHAEGAEDGSTKRVTTSKLPETGKELGQTAIRKRETENCGRNGNALNLNVEEREEEGCGRETKDCARA